jgi:hypothetical protein
MPFNKKRMFEMLKSIGVVDIQVEFDGGGDNGNVDSITYNGLLSDKEYNEMEAPANFPDLLTAMQTIKATLSQLVDYWSYDLLGETDHDWVNNDGGYGSMTIKVDAGTARVDMNIRETISHYFEHDVGLFDADGLTLEGNEAREA